MFSGISGETALGRIVSIRSEKDPNTIKNFTPEQKKIRRDWKAKQQALNPEATTKYLNSLETMFKAMCKG